jgi:hypothetical protein
MLEPGTTGDAAGAVAFTMPFIAVGAWEATWADTVDNAAQNRAAVQKRYFMIPRSRKYWFSKKGGEKFSPPSVTTN